MTEDELKAIETDNAAPHGRADKRIGRLVAEVRRLQVERDQRETTVCTQNSHMQDVQRRHDALYANFADVHAALGEWDDHTLTAAGSVRRLLLKMVDASNARGVAEQKVQGLAAELTATQFARDEARRQLRAVKAGVGDVWRWQPDGGNFPVSMSASLAVVMTADTLRDFIEVRAALEQRGCEKDRTIDACLASSFPCATCSALGACPV